MPGIREHLPIHPDVARTLADNAIGLFLEYRDQHGYAELTARVNAVRDVVEGAQTTPEDINGIPVVTGPPYRYDDIVGMIGTAIAVRLHYIADNAIRAAALDERRRLLVVRLNSGGNYIAAQDALTRAGIHFTGDDRHDVLTLTISDVVR